MDKTLANGAELTAETWADFVARLHHDCVGKGVEEHYTADAVFLVQARVKVWTPDGCDGETFEIYRDGETYDAAGWYEVLDAIDQRRLDDLCHGQGFLSADMYEQISALIEICPDAEPHQYNWGWQTVNQHFTDAAAKAFIKRKKHDYRDGLRVYVDCSCYSWELNAIKAAMLSGKIGFIHAPGEPS